MQLRPLHDQVVLKRVDLPRTSKGGIHLPDTAVDKDRGVVVAVGPGYLLQDGTTRVPLTVRIGDRVAFQKYAGQKITGHAVAATRGLDEDHLVIREEDILFVEELDKPQAC